MDAPTHAPLPPAAVCLHGFLRTGLSMWPTRQRLLAEGYADVACPTWRYEFRDLDWLGGEAAARIAALSAANGDCEVDVVTHSMGGLVLRSALRHGPPVRRVVMLCPPNQGAQAAAEVRSMLPLHRVLGWDPLAPLLPGRPALLPAASDHPTEIAVITGVTGDGPGLAQLLDGDNDGKVRVEEARLAGLADFLVLPVGHTWIMADEHVLDRAMRFLRTGGFGRQPGDLS